MILINEMKQIKGLTEREQDICKYILQYPEKISIMSSRDLGYATFTSAATVTRFCKKIGCKGYPDFKIRFLSEIKLPSSEESEELLEISERDSIISIIKKVEKIQNKAIKQTKQEVSIEQIMRIGEMLYKIEYIDFYVYDINVHLAEYGCSQFFHCGKIANTYTATNIQQLLALMKKENHISIIISHTGENSRLIEIAKSLKRNKTKTIVITPDKNRTLSEIGDEVIYAASEKNLYEFSTVIFSSSVKYILDILFCMIFVKQYKENMNLNKKYEKIGRDKLWALLNDV